MAAYSYHMANDRCVAFKAVRGGVPSFVVYSDRPLVTTDRVTIVQIASRKLKTDSEQSLADMRAGKVTPAGEVVKALWTIDRILANRQLFAAHPEYCKITQINGRPAIYRALTTNFKMAEAHFRKFFGEPPELTSDHFETLHNARLFFPDGTRPARKEALIAMLEEVYQHLARVKLTPVFGCDTRFVRLSNSSSGLYYYDHDDMRIQPETDKSKQVVYAILHEYGHRHYYKFLSEPERKLVKEKFYEVRMKNRYIDPTANDVKEARKRLIPGVKLRYLGSKRNLKAIGEFEIVPSKTYGKISVKGGHSNFSGPVDAFVSSNWQIVGDEARGGIERPDKYDIVTSDWFPTEYSEKDHYEWYAECFAITVLDHLHGAPREWFDRLIRPL